MDNLKAIAEQLSLGTLLAAALWLGLAGGLVALLRWALDKLARRFNRYRLQISRLFPLLRLIIWTFALLMTVFVILHLPQGALLAVAATVGVALGLAAQDMLRNLIAGVIMLFDRPYRVGDMVRIGEHYGEVKSIDLNLTRLHTFTDDIVTIPNAEVMKQAVVNSNAGELTEMIAVPFHVPAASDIATLKTLAHEAAFCCPYSYLKKPVVIVLEDEVDYHYITKVTIKAYVVDVRYERAMASDIIERVKSALQQHGITPIEANSQRK